MRGSQRTGKLTDAAMKRRWEMVYVPIDYDAAQQRAVDLAAYGVRNWGQTLRGLNRRIVEDGVSFPPTPLKK